MSELEIPTLILSSGYTIVGAGLTEDANNAVITFKETKNSYERGDIVEEGDGEPILQIISDNVDSLKVLKRMVDHAVDLMEKYCE